jgi:signal transduction histidine kinase
MNTGSLMVGIIFVAFIGLALGAFALRGSMRRRSERPRGTLKQWGRSGVYLAACGFSAPFSMPLLMLLPVAVLSIAAAGIGLVLLPVVVMIHRLWTDVFRHLAGWVLGVPSHSGWQSPRGGVLARLRQVLSDEMTWRDIFWLLVHAIFGFAIGWLGIILTVFAAAAGWLTVFWWAMPASDPIQILNVHITDWGRALVVGLPTAVLAISLAWFAIPALAKAHAILTRTMLSPSKLAARVEELAETRAGAVNAHEAELRRIERDLHDGTQARLVSIAMRLGVAEKSLDAEDPATLLVREAREGAEQAMGELRDVIRTMYPPILADRGLDGALAALGARCPVDVSVELGALGKVPAAVEAAAYFVVAEALTNVAKHSEATKASVRVVRDGSLMIIVADNGFGGVDESQGSGVLGMRRRVAALDGTLTVDSPAGGPTVISVEVPCGS